MADSAVSFALEKLLAISSDEAKLLWNISKEFEDIKRELMYIQAFLVDADRKASIEDNRSEGIKLWLKDLTEASFRIEDVIDEYIVYLQQQHNNCGCATSFHKVIHVIRNLKHRHRIASEIQEIKSFVHEIKQRGIAYDFHRSQEQGSSNYSDSRIVKWHDPRLDSRYLEEAEVVGFEGPRDQLIGWLVEGQSERSVISVVGMGGLGKTTLVNRVFNNKKVIAHFDYRVWITVSESYTAEGLMRDLWKKLCKEKRVDPPQGIFEMDRDSLIDEVRNQLQQKRYLVIFYDVWSVTFWGEIKNAMLDNKNGSRIVVTTRKEEVVDSCMNFPFDNKHAIQPLTPEKSMELFCMKAFGCQRCPEDLMNTSSRFVEKCRGLPLAIVSIGSLLFHKERTPFEWEKIFQNLSSEMKKNPLLCIEKILGFSYDDLPYFLKPCLLYIGMYPEDCEMDSTRLIWQWIAEGFVKEEDGKTLEEIAQQYLTELVGRSLVQVSSFTIDGKVESCRVHDLLHDMINTKSKQLSFSQHISNKDKSMSSGMIRRLSIENISNDLTENAESFHTRSLLVFASDRSPERFLQRIPSKYKLLN